MFLYWKAKSVQVNVNFSYLGYPSPPSVENLTTIFDNINEEKEISPSSIQERVCYNSIRISSFDGDEFPFPVEDFEYLITFFADARPFDPNEYPQATTNYPNTESSTIRVHMQIDMRNGGYYTKMISGNPPFAGQFNFSFPTYLNVNGNQYTINTTQTVSGLPFAESPDNPNLQYSATISVT
jgi:hypothetical protein